MARQILSNLFDCGRCGLKNAPGATHCASCGNTLGAAPSPSQSPPVPVPQPAAVQHAATNAVRKSPALVVPRRSPAEWFGWKRLEGTIIHASPQHIGRLQKEWWEIVIKLLFFGTLIVVFGVTALAILITIALLSLIFSSRRSSRPGFVETIATQIASFFILGRIFGPKATIPVADYRVRDNAGVESLIRIEGYLQQGSLAVGDDVVAEGFDHGGTLVFRRGWNRRLNCAIRVKRR
jgi:hypothetical protein